MRVLRWVNTTILGTILVLVEVERRWFVGILMVFLLRDLLLLHLRLSVRHGRRATYLSPSHLLLVLLNHIQIHATRDILRDIPGNTVLNWRSWTLVKMHILRSFNNLWEDVRVLCSYTCSTSRTSDPLLSRRWPDIFVLCQLIIVSLKAAVRDLLLDLSLGRILIECASEGWVLRILLLVWQKIWSNTILNTREPFHVSFAVLAVYVGA